MAVEIKVPALGESVTEATVAKWLVKVGDAVAIDQGLQGQGMLPRARGRDHRLADVHLIEPLQINAIGRIGDPVAP